MILDSQVAVIVQRTVSPPGAEIRNFVLGFAFRVAGPIALRSGGRARHYDVRDGLVQVGAVVGVRFLVGDGGESARRRRLQTAPDVGRRLGRRRRLEPQFRRRNGTTASADSGRCRCVSFIRRRHPEQRVTPQTKMRSNFRVITSLPNLKFETLINIFVNVWN